MLSSDRSDNQSPPGGGGGWSGEQLSPAARNNEAISSAGRHHSERQTPDSGPTSRAAVAVACTACRSRHLKCDGQSPCDRCTTELLSCSYVKSRRGWKGPRSKGTTTGYTPGSGMAVSSKFFLFLSCPMPIFIIHFLVNWCGVRAPWVT
jgi:hypothetical protein